MTDPSPNFDQAPAPLAVDADGAAAMCSMSRRTWYAAWAAGLTPEGVKIGRQRRWIVEELRQWLNAGCPPRSVWTARKAQRDASERIATLKVG